MNETQKILEEAKQKIRGLLGSIRIKVWLYSLVPAVACFSALSFFLLRSFSPWMLIAYLIFSIFIFLRIRFDLRWNHLLDYYEQGLKNLDKPPENAEDYAGRGWIFEDLGFYEAAAENFRNALELEPENEDYLAGIIAALWDHTPDRGKLLPYLNRLIEIGVEEKAFAYMRRGQLLAESDPESALNDFDRAIELEPEDSEYSLAKLRFFIETDHLEDAADFLPEAVEAVEKEGGYEKEVLYELQARFALKSGDAESVVKLASQSLKIVPKNKNVLLLRGEAYESLSQFEKADADRRKAAELSEE